MMDLDFYWRYKDAKEEELLEVFQQPERYQPALVEVVKRILVERAIIANDDEYEPDGMRDVLTDDWEATKPPAWIKAVLILATIQFFFVFLLCFGSIYDWVTYKRFDFIYLFLSSPFAYIPITCYLLLKKSTWGWILLFVWVLFLFTMAVVWMAKIAWNAKFYLEEMLTPSWMLVFYGILLFCCWRSAMIRYFGVAGAVRRKSLTIGLAISVMLMVIAYLVTG